MTKQQKTPVPPASTPIRVVSLPCGRARDRKHKEVFGVGWDTCDSCHAKNVPCASASHAFGIVTDADSRIRDIVDDLL